MNSKKLKLSDLAVKSFITSEASEKINGGGTLTGMSESTCMTNDNCAPTLQVECLVSAAKCYTANACYTGTQTYGPYCEPQ